LFFIVLFSCKNSSQLDDETDNSSSKSYPVALKVNDYNVPAGCNENKMEADTLYVINSQDELLSWVPCAGVISNIDWEKETLLITWDRRCNADSKVVEKKFEETAENVFLFQVKVQPSLTANAAPLIIYTIVPKLPKNVEVGFSIDLQGLENNTVAHLQNTSWKLVGFVNETDSTFKSPEPASDDSYWIIFNDDDTFQGKSSTNEITGNYTINSELSSLQITKLGGTKINELQDGNLFMESLRSVNYFSVREATLSLYLDDNKYLLFNRTQL
jgi:hypothetical protein